MTSTISESPAVPEDAADKLASCLGWLMVFGLLGALATFGMASTGAKWSDQEALRRRKESMASQLQQIRRGEIHCLVQPELDFIEELVADADCAANIEELCLGRDVSDERLGQLRRLPNLKCVVLLFADNADVFLERLQGVESIETLNLEHTPISRRGIEAINSLSQLKSLSLYFDRDHLGDLDGLKHYPTLESLALYCRQCDDRLLSVLRSLPRLRSVTIEGVDRGDRALRGSDKTYVCCWHGICAPPSSGCLQDSRRTSHGSANAGGVF